VDVRNVPIPGRADRQDVDDESLGRNALDDSIRWASGVLLQIERRGSAPADLRLPDPLAGDVRVLRDCVAHWEEKEDAEARTDSRGRAFRQFAERRPGDDPGEHRFGGGGTYVGGIAVNELRESVLPLTTALDVPPQLGRRAGRGPAI
jgi:hypothetical protein